MNLLHFKVDSELSLIFEHPSLAEAYLALRNDNLEYLKRWIPWAERSDTLDDFEAFIKRSLHNYAEGKGMSFGIAYQGEIVGNIALQGISEKRRKASLGYWLAEDAQGQGIVSRACCFLIDYAFTQLNLTKIQIEVASDNQASRKVCERLGMKLEGIITQAGNVGDRIEDHAIYGLHREPSEIRHG
ncbi:GNAT family N-acetyltransferase [Parendozoicomonas haliclonae]|uniref:Putative ribosomal N-acetyltransferase YdaF n=1 Tax=Parendozoicomonas haliclonae TaxID=1960125 RepID=A0A1X7AJ12_9GAMM|nr:GNAT family protein [Parendozoicomonas haliclonae]SMA44232.1 putative ribosomal N-acetyltransferase YdaF [Parendozoicomonas haliclonae]